MKRGRLTIIAAVACMFALMVIIVLRVIMSGGNDNAFVRTMAELSGEDRARMERLVERSVAGLPRNQESGLVFYKLADQGNWNRIFLLWLIAPPESRLHQTLAAALEREKRQSFAGATLGLAAVVDGSFYVFRSQYSLQLSRYFAAQGSDAMRIECYRLEPESGAWTLLGELREMLPSVLLSRDDLLAAKRGRFNAVAVAR